MDVTTSSSSKKRSLESEATDLNGATTAPETHTHGAERPGTTGSSDEGLIPPKKKAKFAPPRPLRTLHSSGPVASLVAHSTVVSVGISSNEAALGQQRRYGDPPQADSATKTKLASPASEASNCGPAHSTSYCSYCKRSIEGGEGGKRRHQNGQKHVFRVLRGIHKYVAPVLLPFSSWRYPAEMARLSSPTDIENFVSSQLDMLESLSLAPSDTPEAEFKASYGSIDWDLAVFLHLTRPSNLSKRLGTLDFALLVKVSSATKRLCLPPEPVQCPMCDASSTYCAQPVRMSTNSTENTCSSTASGDASISSSTATSTMHEEQYLSFVRHMASELHRKTVLKFWRDHHVSHPSLPSFGHLTSPQTSKSMLSKTEPTDPRLDPYTSHLFNLSTSFFLSTSYAMEPAHYQEMMESWSRLHKTIRELVIEQPLAAAEVNPPIPFVALPMPFMLPYYLPVAPHVVPDMELSLKQRILKFTLPGPPKKGDRIGSQWADAVKAFIAATPGMTTLQLIKLSKLERYGDARLQPSWFPSFGGVWNETTRADHRRAFFKSSGQESRR